MKVSVLGAGAIGSMLGGLLKHHAPEIDVTLIVRGQHGQTIEEQGYVKLDGPWGSHHARPTVSFAIEDLEGSDFVLLTVKSQATEQAIRDAQPYLGSATLISVQNGINHPVLTQHVDPGKLVMGMTATNMAILEPGSVSLQLDGTTVLGSVSRGASEAVTTAADVLRKTGLQIDEHANVLGIQYNKLAMNALGYASCMSASNFITEAICHRDWRGRVGLPIIGECIQAYEAAGITLAKIPGRPDVRRLRKFLGLLNVPVMGNVVSMAAKQGYNKKPIVFSLYQDLTRRKATEVEFINGEIARLSQENGLAAPHNARVVEMVHELERRGDGSFFARSEVIERFSQPAADVAGQVLT